MGGIWVYIVGALGARNRLFRVYLGCRRRILGMYMPPAATRCCDNKAAIMAFSNTYMSFPVQVSLPLSRSLSQGEERSGTSGTV
jgi:hypothetical protein